MQTRILCLEGLTGAGKTTQAKRIADSLDSLQKSYLVVNEKRYEPFKQTIIDWHNAGANQDFTFEMITTIAKAKGETHRRHFVPLIGRIDYLIFDRGLYTSGIYQAGVDLTSEEIIELNLREGVIKPQEGLVFLCSPAVARMRTDERRAEINYNLPSMHETIEEIKKRRELYLQLLENHPELYLIDAGKTEDEVFEVVRGVVGL